MTTTARWSTLLRDLIPKEDIEIESLFFEAAYVDQDAPMVVAHCKQAAFPAPSAEMLKTLAHIQLGNLFVQSGWGQDGPGNSLFGAWPDAERILLSDKKSAHVLGVVRATLNGGRSVIVGQAADPLKYCYLLRWSAALNCWLDAVGTDLFRYFVCQPPAPPKPKS